MKNCIEQNSWTGYLTEFTKRNLARPTWLQVLGEDGAQSEQSGLPLNGISVEMKGADAPRVQIMFGGRDHLTHVVRNVETMMQQVGTDGRDEAIEFVDKNGEASLLIFRHRARMAACATAH
jgi:hypothetical protein